MPPTADRKKEIGRAAAKILLETQAVLINIETPFTYTSGRKGPVYVDCRRLISFVSERGRLMDMAVELVEDLQIDFVAGGETAGIPYAAFIAERLQKPMLYVRKKPKGFGRMAQIEGLMEQDGRRILLTEDVQNYGTSFRIFIKALREAGAVVEDAFVLFSHGHKASLEEMADANVRLHALATWPDILAVAKTDNYFDPEVISSVESYLQDPEGWAGDNTGILRKNGA